jgi:YD repeat-containing protein
LVFDEDLLVEMTSRDKESKEGAKRTFDYRDGRVVARSRQHGQSSSRTEYRYSRSDELMMIDDGSDPLSFTYDGELLASADHGGQECVYTYDSQGRLEGAKDGSTFWTLEYDLDDRVVALNRESESGSKKSILFDYEEGEMHGVTPTLATIHSDSFPGAELFGLDGRRFENLPIATLQLLDETLDDQRASYDSNDPITDPMHMEPMPMDPMQPACEENVDRLFGKSWENITRTANFTAFTYRVFLPNGEYYASTLIEYPGENFDHGGTFGRWSSACNQISITSCESGAATYALSWNGENFVLDQAHEHVAKGWKDPNQVIEEAQRRGCR